MSVSATSNAITHGFAFSDKMDQALVYARNFLLEFVSSLHIVHYANYPGESVSPVLC